MLLLHAVRWGFLCKFSRGCCRFATGFSLQKCNGVFTAKIAFCAHLGTSRRVEIGQFCPKDEARWPHGCRASTLIINLKSKGRWPIRIVACLCPHERGHLERQYGAGMLRGCKDNTFLTKRGLLDEKNSRKVWKALQILNFSLPLWRQQKKAKG